MGVTGAGVYGVGTWGWTRPADCELVEVVLLGGGGGGGRGSISGSGIFRCGGSGGGGGAFTRCFILPADAGATRNVVVGAGGTSTPTNSSSPANGVNGFDGGHTYFGSAVNANLGLASAGAGGPAGQNGAGAVGAASGGYGTLRGGDGASGWSVAVPATPPTRAMMAPGGGGGGGVNSSNGAYAGGTGAWTSANSDQATHPPVPIGGAPDSGAAGGIGGSIAGLGYSFGGASGGGGGGRAGAAQSGPGNQGGPGCGGGGGGAATSGGTANVGNTGGGGLAVIVSHGKDVEQRSGSVAGPVAVSAAVVGRRVISRATLATVAVTGSVVGKATHRGVVVGPVGITASSTRVPTHTGRVLGPVAVTGLAVRAGLTKSARGTLAVTGLVVGSPIHRGLVTAPVGLVGLVTGARGSQGKAFGTVAITGRVRSGRYWQITPPTEARYLTGHSAAVYYTEATRALYEGTRSRALYDSGVPETIPWMAGQRRGSIRAQLVDANGPIAGLASAVGVYLTARRQSDGLGVVNASVVVEDAVLAIVRYDPQAGEFDVADKYDVQWLIVHGGDLPQYVPDSGFDTLDALSPLVAFP